MLGAQLIVIARRCNTHKEKQFMTSNLTAPPRREFQSFHDFPIVTDLDNLDADIAILGIPFGDPYSMGEASNDQSNAPTHIRRYCERALRGLDRYDFDIGGTLLDGRDIKVVDCGAKCSGSIFFVS